MPHKKNRKESESVHKEKKDEVPVETAAAPEGEAVKAEPDDLQARLEAKEKEAAENYDRWVRALAEMENYKKRAAREREEAIKYGNEKLIKDILPILDSLDRALHQSSEESVKGNFEAFRKGLELIGDQILGCLERHGVARIQAKGEEFDPDKHQALMQVETPDMDSNRVVDEFETGYTLSGRLLRPSKVSVSKKTEGQGQ